VAILDGLVDGFGDGCPAKGIHVQDAGLGTNDLHHSLVNSGRLT
jgi:hypothetical protein